MYEVLEVQANSCYISLVKPHFSRYDTMVVLGGLQQQCFQLFHVKFYPPETILTIEILSGTVTS